MSSFETTCSVYAELFMKSISLEINYFEHSPTELFGILNHLQSVWNEHIDSFDGCGDSELLAQSVALKVYDDCEVTKVLFFLD